MPKPGVIRDNGRAMHEAYTVLRRYADVLTPNDRLCLLVDYRKAIAKAELRNGLTAYFAGQSQVAWAALRKAAAYWPPSFATRLGAQLWLRLSLPHVLKQQIFQVP